MSELLVWTQIQTEVYGTVNKAIVTAPNPILAQEARGIASGSRMEGANRGGDRVSCFHCGEPCPDASFNRSEKVFCCQGCLFVHDLLNEAGLERFYDLDRYPGVRIKSGPTRQHWSFLDEPELQAKLVDFSDGKTSRITFHIPAIHCVACVWLLENLFQLLPGLGASQVNFPRREVCISFEVDRVRLSRLVALLASIGYEPELNFGQLERPKRCSANGKKLWLQIGLAGFAFGNIMLFSLPSYLGLDSLSGPAFKLLFGYLSLFLAVPVLIYSASDYWRSAYVSARQRILTLDVPIALGLAAIYAQSVFEVVSGRGEGYADSLAGLVFFLLCGRAFQQRTHDRLAFDRDFKSFFPLSVRRTTDAGEESVSLVNLQVGDRLLLRHGELIPADAKLLIGHALIDYSFVTGESEPVEISVGERLYAGGQQAGGTIEIQTVKPVSQSYLTSLWNHELFRKERGDNLNTLTNRYSRRFTRVVIAVACGSALVWLVAGNPGRGLKAFTSVLIVACPCALALAAPFGLGTAQRLLAKTQVFLKNILVLERLAEIDTIVFDKTGTLTSAHGSEVSFYGLGLGRPGQPNQSCTRSEAAAGPLNSEERSWVCELASHSTHPHARRIGGSLKTEKPGGANSVDSVLGFAETGGGGILGFVQGHEIRLGSLAWFTDCHVNVPRLQLPGGSVSHLSIDGRFRGAFVLANALRPQTDRLFAELGRNYELVLLSGDNEKERARFTQLFGEGARLRFHQTPLDKLSFVESLKDSGKTVMMVGDGLNDAGALKRSDVGVAVVEKIGVFSPASDIIMEAGQVPQLFRLLQFARKSTRIVRASFGLSAAYNLVGISIAAAGILSPLVCAVLMPLSSISVVLFSCGLTTWAAKRAGLGVNVPRAENSKSGDSLTAASFPYETAPCALISS